VPGAVALLAGEPGVGKSTLLLEVAHRWAEKATPARSLCHGRGVGRQVRLRAERTGNLHRRFPGRREHLSAVLSHVQESSRA